MCYIIITSGSLVWFLLTLIADMLVASAIVTPKWLIGPSAVMQMQQQQRQPPNVSATITTTTTTRATTTASTLLLESREDYSITPPMHTVARYPSVGIYTRCKILQSGGYHCGRFDLDGFGTDSAVYPNEWKAAMFFIMLGFSLLTLTVFLTLLTCCRQSAFGKSIHNMTACAQVVAAISVMLALFLHPLGWRAERVQRLCGIDAEPFYPAACSIGISFYCAVAGVLLTFLSAGVSLKAESSNMRRRVRRRVEEGDRLVCIP